jgi:hypothetical protein
MSGENFNLINCLFFAKNVESHQVCFCKEMYELHINLTGRKCVVKTSVKINTTQINGKVNNLNHYNTEEVTHILALL